MGSKPKAPPPPPPAPPSVPLEVYEDATNKLKIAYDDRKTLANAVSERDKTIAGLSGRYRRSQSQLSAANAQLEAQKAEQRKAEINAAAGGTPSDSQVADLRIRKKAGRQGLKTNSSTAVAAKGSGLYIPT